MRCPSCRADDTKVVDSRLADEGSAIRRRRQCVHCTNRFTTYERLEELPLMVIKTHGGREPFDRVKVMTGVMSACKGRPVAVEAVQALSTFVEDEARLRGNDVPSSVIGLAVLERLRVLDEVAYLRFASVYKNFDTSGDFAEELRLLHKLNAHSG